MPADRTERVERTERIVVREAAERGCADAVVGILFLIALSLWACEDAAGRREFGRDARAAWEDLRAGWNEGARQ